VIAAMAPWRESNAGQNQRTIHEDSMEPSQPPIGSRLPQGSGQDVSAPMAADRRPVLLLVDDEADWLDRIGQELRRRYSSDYRILCERSAAKALQALEAVRAAGEDVAVVLADQWIPEVTGSELLARVRELHPHAKRALLITWGAWGDRPTADAVLRAMALGHIDYYVLKPWQSPDELFHRTVTEFLHEWTRTHTSRPREIAIVAERRSPRAHDLSSLLGRNGVPHTFHPSDSAEGRRLLGETGREKAEVPVVVLLDGRVLVNPSNAELAGGYGVATELDERRDFDVVVVGAGPAGLAAAVYASSEGLRTLVVERESIGGQAGSSSLIRNYLGFSRGVSGADLAQRAYQQAWVFGTNFVLMREVVGLRAERERRLLTISDGSEATARAVVLAMGVSYRRLGISALEALNGTGVFYGASVSEVHALARQDAYIVGGGNSAGQAAVHLSRYAKQVSVLVRGSSLADSMSPYLVDELAAAGNIDVRSNTQVIDGGGQGRLERLTLRDTVTGETYEVEAAALFVLIGARPHTDWLPEVIARDDWGFLLTGPDLTRKEGWSPEQPAVMYETSMPGLFAVGDVRHGSVKRVASAVGEGSVVIQQVREYLKSSTVTGSAS
jgi:thioredoxin reductase (NADPH)